MNPLKMVLIKMEISTVTKVMTRIIYEEMIGFEEEIDWKSVHDSEVG